MQLLGKEDFKAVQNEVQQKAARWWALLPLSALIPGFFAVLVIGPLSDVIGKKKLMILPPFTYLVQSCIFIGLCSLEHPFSPAFFFIPYCLTGIFGDAAGVNLLCAAYMANVTKQEERTLRFAMLDSAYFISVIVGVGLSGLTLSYLGYIGTLSVIAVMCVANLAYTIFFLPSEKSITPLEVSKEAILRDSSQNLGTSENENLLAKSENQTKERYFVSLQAAVNLREILNKIKETLSKNGVVKMIAVLLVLYSMTLFVNMGEIYMGILFMKHAPFNMKPLLIGYLIMTSYLFRFIGVITIPYICVRCFKMEDTGLLIIGFASQVAFFFLFGFSVNTQMLFAITPLSIGIVVSQPVLRAMMSKLVDSDQHGTAFAMAEAIEVLSSLLASLFTNMIYSATVKIFSGFALCCLAMVAFAGLIGAIALRFNFKSLSNESNCNKEREGYSLINSRPKEDCEEKEDVQ